ncbi:MAG: CHASE3 domain-containing protein [Deltaproteobacteria bacterium]|nr:CHASE3 domain-containing protein [Deltaproteobacteria bacterium]
MFAPATPSAVVCASGRSFSRQRLTAWLRGSSIRTRIAAVALAAVLPTLAALVVLASRIAQLNQATLAVAATFETIQHGSRVVKLLSDMQLATRAYAISGDSLFLDSYQQARKQWPEAITAAANALRNDPSLIEQLARVEDDANDFFTEWERRLGSMLPAGDDANAWFQLGKDETRMRRITATIAAMVSHKEGEIRTRLQDAEQARRRVYAVVAAISLLAIALLAGLTTILGRSIGRPIEHVVEAAHRLAEGEWGERVPVQGGRETRILANAFNRMTAAVKDARAELAQRNHQLEHTAARLASANEGLVERQRETDDFLYVLSHDLRAPLINIQGFGKRLQSSMTTLETSLADPAKQGDCVKQLQRMNESLKFVNLGTGKIDQLIARLLEIARVSTRPSQYQWVNTEALVHDVLGACRFQLEERGIETTVGTLPPVLADPLQLNQVFTNLIDNAIKYMGQRPLKRISIYVSVSDDRYRFAVQDSGPGIAPKDQEKVFRMFARLNPSASAGEGIGLAVVRAIVNHHGGRIWVESTPEVGTTFYFTLPRPADEKMAAAPGSPASSARAATA